MYIFKVSPQFKTKWAQNVKNKSSSEGVCVCVHVHVVDGVGDRGQFIEVLTCKHFERSFSDLSSSEMI